MSRAPTTLVSFLILGFAACLSGCQSATTQSSAAMQTHAAAQQPAEISASAHSSPQRGTTSSSPATSTFSVVSSVDSAAALEEIEYRLAPQDVIEVSVFQVPDLAKTVEISAKGEIVLPLIGVVQAGGRTIAELENEIEAKLSKDYLQSPQVSVMVKDYKSQKVTVDGAVGKPGVYEVPGGASLLRVLAMAGGLDRVADSGTVIVYRNQGGRRTSAAFDIDVIRKGRAEDPVVRGGDTVVVGESDARVAWRNVRESVGVAGFATGFIP